MINFLTISICQEEAIFRGQKLLLVSGGGDVGSRRFFAPPKIASGRRRFLPVGSCSNSKDKDMNNGATKNKGSDIANKA